MHYKYINVLINLSLLRNNDLVFSWAFYCPNLGVLFVYSGNTLSPCAGDSESSPSVD